MEPTSLNTMTPLLLEQALSSLKPQAELCIPPISVIWDEIVQKEAPITFPMTWRSRGKYHSQRKESDLAIECYTKALEEAEEQQNIELMAECLKELGIVFLDKEEWTFAAKIFNGALALLQKKSNEKACETILSWMIEVERRFLDRAANIKTSVNSQVYLERRKRLQALRHAATLQLPQEKADRAQAIVSTFTQSICSFVEELVQKGIAILGEAPCNYTLVGLGSLARKEMSPYSDLEFALIIQDSSVKHLKYFRNMVIWLELQVIHLGETAIKILKAGHESPVVRGFSFDDGGNTPLGKQEYVELIKTPEELAELQSERFYQEDVILSNVLRNSTLIVGSESLHQRYLQAMKALLHTKSAKSMLSIQQERALHLIRNHLIEFEPRVDKKKENVPIFNLKMELYRPLCFLIEGLADYARVEEQNTWKRLEALVEKQVLSSEGAQHIKNALSATLLLRIRCHIFYGRECEDVYHPSMQFKGPEKGRQQIFILSNTEINQLIEIYRVIFPLHRLLKQASLTKDFSELAHESFYDSSQTVQGEAHEKLFQFQEAKKCFQQAVALDPGSPDCLLHMGKLFNKLAEYAQAQEYAVKALDISKRLNNEKNFISALNLSGTIYLNLGNARKAIECFELVLPIATKMFSEEHPNVAACLSCLGSAWQNLGETKKAIAYFTKAYKIDIEIYGHFHPENAQNLSNLGSAWQDNGDMKKAVVFYELALKRFIRFYGEEHPDVAICLNNLGGTVNKLGDAKKAIDYLEKALRISKKIFGVQHPEVASTLNNLGLAWKALGQTQKAVSFHQEAIKMMRNLGGNQHPAVAVYLSNLGTAWQTLGEVKKAITYFEESLKINQKVYGREHPSITICLNNLGTAWRALGDMNKAKGFFEEALSIGKKVYGTDSPEVATYLYNLGSFMIQGETNRAIEYLEEALRIDKKAYGDHHAEVGNILGALGLAYQTSGQRDKARTSFNQALQILIAVHSKDHASVRALQRVMVLTKK